MLKEYSSLLILRKIHENFISIAILFSHQHISLHFSMFFFFYLVLNFHPRIFVFSNVSFIPFKYQVNSIVYFIQITIVSELDSFVYCKTTTGYVRKNWVQVLQIALAVSFACAVHEWC